MGLLTSPAQNNSIMPRIKLVAISLFARWQYAGCDGSFDGSRHIALVYSHKTNVVIVTLLAFVMIYNTVILVNPAAAFGDCHLRLPLVLTNFG